LVGSAAAAATVGSMISSMTKKRSGARGTATP
jgi:hypothetical protein